jgi:hypothetical protein
MAVFLLAEVLVEDATRASTETARGVAAVVVAVAPLPSSPSPLSDGPTLLRRLFSAEDSNSPMEIGFCCCADCDLLLAVLKDRPRVAAVSDEVDEGAMLAGGSGSSGPQTSSICGLEKPLDCMRKRTACAGVPTARIFRKGASTSSCAVEEPPPPPPPPPLDGTVAGSLLEEDCCFVSCDPGAGLGLAPVGTVGRGGPGFVSDADALKDEEEEAEEEEGCLVIGCSAGVGFVIVDGASDGEP